MTEKLNQSLSGNHYSFNPSCYVGVIGEKIGVVKCPLMLDICAKVTPDNHHPTFSCLSRQLLDAIGYTGAITKELNCQYVTSARSEYCACTGDSCNTPRKLS